MEIQQLQGKVYRLEQALIEERSARQTIEEDIWKAIGRLEQKVCPPEEKCDPLIKATCNIQEQDANGHQQEETSNLQQKETRSLQQEETSNLQQETNNLQQEQTCTRQEGDGEDVTTPPDDAHSKSDVIKSDDVTTQAAPAGGDLNKTDPSETNINVLDTELLKMVLRKMDCLEMFRARRVCRSWRSAVDGILDDCRRKLADRSARGFNTLTLTNLELVIRAKDQPKMTSLKAPTAEKGTDIRLVVGSCHALQTADLRGFKLRTSALRHLARANASSLRELTLPAGIGDCQLEALLEPLKALERLNLSLPVNSTGKWLWLLPKSLKRLDITGSGMTRSPVSYDPGKLSVGVQLATDKLLDQLSVLSNRQPDYRVSSLTILESPSVTPGALARLLASITSLWCVKLGVVGATLETTLAALHGCSGLEVLRLTADPRPLTDIPALTESEVAAVCRMAKACRKLQYLYLTSSAVNCQAVLAALLKTGLGCTDRGQCRYISLYVPRAVLGRLSKPPDGSNVDVRYFD
ncbi:uncharacterized protein LOC122390794 [Amphibalanus amphitrite]|uniref:uncharacterized protein LOC122390794 n=1 Tax=Amphibalanus amphitrite TaxID=1232801 RepID=UPI001C910E06|nr:uncharacterized protein LOC122390794 [Amphibalanus amphitrite]XP_043240037.1 uncharacterized protein LOC122390794 [Amphibalanus amphitrite]XP_043240039.1 uncharacterized protein LOC122390794 [Amphibalanus amphitrite]